MVKIRKTSRHADVQHQYDEDKIALQQLYGDDIPCPFCAPDRKRIEELKTMQVLYNDYPYEYFDGRYVKEHIMIVPRRHINLFDSYTAQEHEEYWQLFVKYQLLGYASLTRPVGDTHRSVPAHLHTHLLTYHD